MTPDPADPPRLPPAERLLHRFDGLRRRSPAADRLFCAGERYGRDNVEFYALKVVSRGLFLTVSVSLLLLYVLGGVTSLLPGVNEITIPTMPLPDQTDLGDLVHRTYLATRVAVLDVVGLVTLVVSAVFTATALRQGFAHVVAPHRPRPHLLQARNLVIGLGVAAAILLTWLLTLATAVRTRAIATLVGFQPEPWAVAGGKFLTIVLQVVLLTGLLALGIRRLNPDLRVRPVLAASGAFAVFTTLANFVLLYSYIAALFDPDTSGGVVLVLTLLAWVNVVVRSALLAACWLLPAPPTGPHHPGP